MQSICFHYHPSETLVCIHRYIELMVLTEAWILNTYRLKDRPGSQLELLLYLRSFPPLV